MLAGISPSKTEGAVEEVDSSAWSAGTEASGSLDSWGGGWQMVEGGAQGVFLGGGEDMGREECDIAPLRSPYIPSTSEPVTAASIFSNPSVSRCWVSLSSLCASSHSKLAHFNRFSPYKRKDKKGNKGIALQKSLETTRKEGRINLPLSTAQVPPLQVKLESPPPEPSSIKCQCPSLPWFAIWELPPQQNYLSGRRRVGMRRIGWRKKMKALNNISVQNSNKKRGCTTRTVCCGLPTRPHHCLNHQFIFFHLSYQFLQPCLLSWCQYTLGKGK